MQKGDFIKIDYVGRLESGEIFDLSIEETARKENIYNEKIKYRTMSVIVGAGFVISGLDRELLAMEVGEKKTVSVASKDAFGERNPSLLRTVSEKEFRGQVEPRPGMIVDFSDMRGRIQSVSAGRVRVDFNHPLAGKNLIYEVEIKDRIDRCEEKISAILEFFGIDAELKVHDDTVEIELKKPLAHQVKEKVSSLILEYVMNEVKSIGKVKFTEVFEKKTAN